MSDSDNPESTPLDQLLQAHRKEKKDLQVKLQTLKKSATKGDKKKKKEVTEEIARLESEQNDKHAREIAELKSTIKFKMSNRGGASNTRVPRHSNTYESDLAAANLFKEKNIHPPPLYPNLEYKAASLNITPEKKNIIDIKKSIEEKIKENHNKSKIKEMEWKLVPNELRIGIRKRKTVDNNLSKKNKGKDIEWLKKLEENENIKRKKEKEDIDEDETNKKKQIKEEVEDDEELVEEEEDDEMDEGTDYIQNYFDNGEDYIDSNDDMDDGPVY